MSFESQLAGFFFYFIIVTNIMSNVFGYKTLGKEEATFKLNQINSNKNNFKISFVLIMLEHLGIIFLVIMLFLAYNSFNILLAIIWILSRSGEAISQIYHKILSYWKLLGIAEDYESSNEDDKSSLIKKSEKILSSKNSNFVVAQILFSIGTFSYSLLFVIYDILPIWIGYFGIIASILYGIDNFISYRNQFQTSIWDIAGIFILIFEIILGGWLLFDL